MKHHIASMALVIGAVAFLVVLITMSCEEKPEQPDCTKYEPQRQWCSIGGRLGCYWPYECNEIKEAE